MTDNVTYACQNEACIRFNQEFQGPTASVYRVMHNRPLRCAECRKIPKKLLEVPFTMDLTPAPTAAEVGGWRLDADWDTGLVRVTQGDAGVTLNPSEATEVGQRLIDAAWNLAGGPQWHLQVATGRFSFTSERERAAFRAGAEAMGARCEEVLE